MQAPPARSSSFFSSALPLPFRFNHQLFANRQHFRIGILNALLDDACRRAADEDRSKSQPKHFLATQASANRRQTRAGIPLGEVPLLYSPGHDGCPPQASSNPRAQVPAPLADAAGSMPWLH